MHHRAFVLAGMVILAAAVPAAGQGPSANQSAEQGAYAVPRTPDGQPDLQGFWTNQTYTPLERPDSVEPLAKLLGLAAWRSPQCSW